MFGAADLPEQVALAELSAAGIHETVLAGHRYTYGNRTNGGGTGAWDFDRMFLPVRGVGRFDDDQYDDFVVVSGLTRDSTGGLVGEAVLYVIYGRPEFPPELTLHSAMPPPESLAVRGIPTASSDVRWGISPPADLNGDRLGEIVFRVWTENRSWVIWGESGTRRTGEVSLRQIPCTQVEWGGAGTAFADFDGDDRDDVVFHADDPGRGDSFCCSRVHGSSVIRLSGVAESQMERACELGRGEVLQVLPGPDVQFRSGPRQSWVEPAHGSDVDGDGVADLILWAQTEDLRDQVYVVYGSQCMGYELRLANVAGYPEGEVTLEVYAVTGEPVSAVHLVIDAPAELNFVPPNDPRDLVQGTAIESDVERVLVEEPVDGVVSVAVFADFDPPFEGNTLQVCPMSLVARLRFAIGAVPERRDLPVRLVYEAGDQPQRSAMTNPLGLEVRPGLIEGKVQVVGFFTRGDANGDRRVSISDVVFILRGLFLFEDPETLPFPCRNAGDVNDDQNLDVADVIYLVNYLFMQGEPPPFPTPPGCGADPTGYLLEPECFEACP